MLKVRTFNFLICGLFVAGMIIAADLPSVPEQFTGRIVDVGQAVRGAGSTYFTVHIDSYTTDEKVQELATLLATEGQEALEDALWDFDQGWIRIGSRLGYPLAIARSFEVDGGRVVRVITDRPISMFARRGALRSTEYPFGIVELYLDAKGKGEGRMIAAASAAFTEEGRLEIESLGTEPFRIMKVKVDKLKKKKEK